MPSFTSQQQVRCPPFHLLLGCHSAGLQQSLLGQVPSWQHALSTGRYRRISCPLTLRVLQEAQGLGGLEGCPATPPFLAMCWWQWETPKQILQSLTYLEASIYLESLLEF